MSVNKRKNPPTNDGGRTQPARFTSQFTRSPATRRLSAQTPGREDSSNSRLFNQLSRELLGVA